MIQLYTLHAFVLLQILSHIGYYRILSRAPCATQQVLVGYLIYGIYVCVCIYISAKSLQPCPALCNRMDCSPPGSSVCGTLQARIPEWVAISFSRVSSSAGIKPMSLTSALAGRFFTTGATWEALIYPSPFPFGDSEIVFYVRKSVSVL